MFRGKGPLLKKAVDKMRLISKRTLLLFFLPGAVFMGAFLVYPIISMVFDSFFEIGITGERSFIGLDNYIHAFTAGGFMKQLKNTLLYILLQCRWKRYWVFYLPCFLR